MKRTFLAFTVAIASVLFLSVATLQAQDIQASANVLTSLEFTNANALSFGDIVQGTTPSISADNSEAGNITLEGTSGENVTIGFSTPLPDSLYQGGSDGNGFDGLEITFGSSDGGYSTDGGSTINTFDPSNEQSGISLGGNGSILIYIGGTLHPTNDQPGGSYSNSITVTASYDDV